MKVTLFAVGALILLSSITSIFNNLVVVDTSAQLNEDRDAFDAVLEHLAEDNNNRYNDYDNSDSSSYEQSSNEYSSYDNYEPSDYGNSYDSSYNNDGYGAKNSYYMDDKYSKYPPKEYKKFTCPNSGLVVDKRENCPVICPIGSTLEGHFVKAGTDLQYACNLDPGTFETCGSGTDLEGVLVSDAPFDCNIFATCDATDPLGISLGLTGTETVEVADAQLCQLAVPSDIMLQVCETGPMTGAIVTDPLLCEAPNDDNICPANTDLEGVYVNNSPEDCNIFATCTAASPLGMSLGLTGTQTVEVADAQLCNLAVPQIERCTTGPMTGAFVTDLRLCEAPNDDNICPEDTDLEGVYVNNVPADCDLTSGTTNSQAICLKCADLAALSGGAQDQTATALSGSTTDNIFTVCEASDPREDFAALLIPGVPQGQREGINDFFDTCLDNAAASSGTSSSSIQAQTASLQESSLTTNIEPATEIPTSNNEVQNQTINTVPEKPILDMDNKDPSFPGLMRLVP